MRDTHAPLPAPIAILNMIGGIRLAKAMHIAAQLGIADLLKEQPMTAMHLAQATGMHEQSLYRLLRALASIGIFQETEPRVFGETELSRYLCTDQPGSMRDLVLYMLSDNEWEAWGNLHYSIQTGLPAYAHVHGTDAWSYMTSRPEEYAVFNGAMTALSDTAIQPILHAYDFSGIGILADIGGGHGKLLTAILQAYPSMTGILLDDALVMEDAIDTIRHEHLDARCQLVSGDFFDTVPSGADAYMLKHILHDWNDEACGKILRNCHHAMKKGAKLLIAEQVLPALHIPVNAASADLSMLVDTGGRERTREEYETLLTSNGFTVTRVIETRGLTTVLESITA